MLNARSAPGMEATGTRSWFLCVTWELDCPASVDTSASIEKAGSQSDDRVVIIEGRWGLFGGSLHFAWRRGRFHEGMIVILAQWVILPDDRSRMDSNTINDVVDGVHATFDESLGHIEEPRLFAWLSARETARPAI